MTGPSDDAGLRRRKKEQTRAALRACAARLFAEQGFAGTTIADVVACANVSERTFFRYFDSKEDLLLPDMVELFAHVEAELLKRPAGEDPLTAVCQALLAAAQPFAASSLAALTQPLEGTEALIAARLGRAFADFEDRLTELVRQRLSASGESGDFGVDLHAAVIAGAALSAVRAVLRTLRKHSQTGSERPSPAATGQPLSEAFELLSRIGGSS
jgi:AcrR family transcriptional regulator